MHPQYEKSTGYLIIEWYEKRKDGSPIHHYYSEKPKRLQLHPRDPKKVIRALFADKMPGWLEKYAKVHDFECQQVTRSGEVGFWIANWKNYPDGHKPFTSPLLDGAIVQFTRLIPEVCENLRELVLSNYDIIKQNLENYPEAYEEFGLYYRPEEINGIGGATVFEDCIPSKDEHETDDDYRSRIEKDGRLERLVYELITPLPEPVMDGEDEVATELSDIEFEEEEELTIEGIEFEDIEEEELTLDDIEFIDEENTPFSEHEEVTDVDNFNESVNDPEVEDRLVEEESLDDKNPVDNVGEAEMVNDSPEETEKSLEQTSLYADVELQVSDDENYKIVEGQFSLF